MELDDFVLTLSNILKRVDEYSLYCHYLGFDPDIRETYSSPLREGDRNPSFSFYNAYPGSEVEFLWKDNMLNVSGTIVKLVGILYGLSYIDSLKKIDADFKLGFTDGKFIAKRMSLKKPKEKEASTIEVSSKPFMSKKARDFWKEFHITPNTLAHYRVTEIYSSLINDVRIHYPTVAFAYPIGKKYKIYSPLNPNLKFKFVNNYDAKFVEGFHQLAKKSDVLIITKSLKDVMVLYELGYESISPRSESTIMPKEYFTWIDKHYTQVIVLFDNDMKHNGAQYPYDKKYIPSTSNCKDISDYVKKYGKEKGRCLVAQILK